MHDPSIRLPLVIRDPGLSAERRGAVVREIALNIDIAPTLLARAGAPVPSEMQGGNLLPVIHGTKSDDWRTNFFYEHRFTHAKIPQTEGVRDAQWKYTRYVSMDPLYEELFDLQADPHETRNLAGDPQHAERLAALRDRWERLREAAR